MSDPRNVAHAKKVTQEKKHQAAGDEPAETVVAQPGKKTAAKKKRGPAGAATDPGAPTANETPVPNETSNAKPPADLEGTLAVLAKLKDMEFHSRANLERLAELTMTVEDELKQKEMTGPLSEVFSAQNAFQTKLTALIDAYKAECDRRQG
ncbi:MAG TPA: hypothetical protein VNJ02_14835 [Vicinamibacterales bacterium]|nr:hypothetical protein [Vicinamibacterales bacterium]